MPFDIFIGLDPGVSGALAILTEEGKPLQVINNNVAPIRYAKEAHAALTYHGHTVQAVYVEDVHGRGCWGAKASFSFGRALGLSEGVLASCGIVPEYVAPIKWMNALDARTGGDKAISTARAQELFPGIKTTKRNADALLIAEYGRRVTLGLI